MKYLSIAALFLFVALCSFNTQPTVTNKRSSTSFKNAITGAWSLEKNGTTHLLVFTNAHYSYTSYDLAGKKFRHTEGGTYTLNNNQLATKLEFNSSDKSVMGKKAELPLKASQQTLTINWPGAGEQWKRIDDGGGDLNATWRITAREQQGKLNPIQRSARKTIKILSGNRFQWAAINTSTGEFFGTGGGTYTFKDGRYTEHIEFFSRDSSRVGMSLSFEGKVEGSDWHHRGKSSKGDPIYEIWSKED